MKIMEKMINWDIILQYSFRLSDPQCERKNAGTVREKIRGSDEPLEIITFE